MMSISFLRQATGNLTAAPYQDERQPASPDILLAIRVVLRVKDVMTTPVHALSLMMKAGVTIGFEDARRRWTEENIPNQEYGPTIAHCTAPASGVTWFARLIP
ncbi:hypothetical protein RJ035_008220 [Blastomyces gilchristii]